MTASLNAGFLDRPMFAPRSYRLLPFRFTRLDDTHYVMSNEVEVHLVFRKSGHAAFRRGGRARRLSVHRPSLWVRMYQRPCVGFTTPASTKVPGRA
jgi:hypothetical protein